MYVCPGLRPANVLPDPVSDCEIVPAVTENRDAPSPPDQFKLTLVGVIDVNVTPETGKGGTVKVPEVVVPFNPLKTGVTL